jgi:ectoine hydroxylase-related dioxygenase (phytanoyl-CoA dioxygenase family)
VNIAINYVKSVAVLGWMRFFGTKGEFSELKEKTAMIVEGDLPKEVCDALIEKIEAVLADPSHPRVWRDEVGSDSRILGFEQDIGDLAEHFKIERRTKAVDEYLGHPVKSWFLMANRVVPVENNLGSGGGLHRDSPFSHQIKCIWYLNDVNTENGPFEFVPGSHFNALSARDAYPLGEYRFDSVRRGDRLVEVHASAGAMLVCDTKCIHSGKPIESGVRYAVTLYTMSSHGGAADIFRKSQIDPALAQRRIVHD